MPASALVVLLFVSMLIPGAANAAPPQDVPGVVRAMDPQAADALALGLTLSPAFRALVEGMDAWRAVVHVVVGQTRVFATTGATQLASTANGWTFVRIVLDERLRLDERTSVLAHELQHARELLDAGVQSQQDVRQLYERIGRPVPGTWDAFETAAAAEAGVRVWRELRDAPDLRQRLAAQTVRGRSTARP